MNDKSLGGEKERELESLIARVGDLPAMPVIAVRVMELIGDLSTSANDLQELISRDQALTAKILKIANSAIFGVVRDITTLTHAIVILGFSTIRSIVLAASTKSIYQTGRVQTGFNAKLLWEHSLASAYICRRLAEDFRSAELEEAFITGLLHDIGKSVLNVNLPQQYMMVIGEVNKSKRDYIEVERELIGFDHTQVGALVVRKWNLPKDLEDAVLCHHEPADAQVNLKLTATVALANEIANRLGIGPSHAPQFELSESPAIRLLGISENQVIKLLEGIEKILQESRDIFSV